MRTYAQPIQLGTSISITGRDAVQGSGVREAYLLCQKHVIVGPDDLRSELAVAGFRDIRVLGVEGPGWMLPDFDTRWEDAELRKDLLDVGRALEAEPSIVGVSAHLLGIGRKQ